MWEIRYYDGEKWLCWVVGDNIRKVRKELL